MPRKRGLIYLYTDGGEGKTTNALGLALREVGHKQKAVIIQFMKGRKDIGEYKIKNRLKPYYKIYQFGRKGWVNLKKPSNKDKELAQQGFEFSKKIIKEKPDLLVLDEINLAIAIKLLKLDDVIEFLKKIPSKTTVVLTGRRAPKKLIKIADEVTIMKFVKHPFQKGYRARKGIEY